MCTFWLLNVFGGDKLKPSILKPDTEAPCYHYSSFMEHKKNTQTKGQLKPRPTNAKTASTGRKRSSMQNRSRCDQFCRGKMHSCPHNKHPEHVLRTKSWDGDARDTSKKTSRKICSYIFPTFFKVALLRRRPENWTEGQNLCFHCCAAPLSPDGPELLMDPQPLQPHLQLPEEAWGRARRRPCGKSLMGNRWQETMHGTRE